MISFPDVHAIAVVDANGAICFTDTDGKQKSIIDAFSIDQGTIDFDRAVFRRFLTDNDALFVLGTETDKNMGKLLTGKQKIISDGCFDIVQAAFTYAMKHNLSQIVVLGGRAVYDAFSDHYETVTIHRLNYNYCQSPTKIPLKMLEKTGDMYKTIKYQGIHSRLTVYWS